jgi:hypothetical protein
MVLVVAIRTVGVQELWCGNFSHSDFSRGGVVPGLA